MFPKAKNLQLEIKAYKDSGEPEFYKLKLLYKTIACFCTQQDVL